MSAKLSHYYSLGNVPEAMIPRIAREFADHGITRMVFDLALITRGLKDENLLSLMKKCARDVGMQWVSMHAPCGFDYDLCAPNMDNRASMVKAHIKAMEIAKEFGSLTYTVHVGAYPHCCLHYPVDKCREMALETLEKLVPEAERIGIVLAVENSFEPSNSAREVRGLVDHFGDNPAIGVCFDTGHANCMASAPWKKPEGYPDYQISSWWEKGIITEDGALDLLYDKIVTCHIHDNDGYRDLHCLPYDGCLAWDEWLPKLKSAPRMLEFQSEVSLAGGVNWAGTSPAPGGGYSIKRLIDTFRRKEFFPED